MSDTVEISKKDLHTIRNFLDDVKKTHVLARCSNQGFRALIMSKYESANLQQAYNNIKELDKEID
jgi:hypothetical protein